MARSVENHDWYTGGVSAPFSSGSAKALMKRLDGLQEDLRWASSRNRLLAERVEGAACAYRESAAIEALRSVPVEELNRNGGHFRVKALRDAGFLTVADVHTSSEYALLSAWGIGEDSAREIKHTAAQLMQQAAETTRIRLNADARTPEATEVVIATYAFMASSGPSGRCDQLLHYKEGEIKRARETVTTGLGTLRWAFSSRAKKDEVRRTYDWLVHIVNRELEPTARQQIDELRAAENVTAEAAWADFERRPTEYNGVLEKIVPGMFGSDDGLFGLSQELAHEVEAVDLCTDGLICSLRRYQEWGVRYILRQRRVLLGDEMGLGKTVQAIAAMVSLRNAGAMHFLVVCPAGIIVNWCKEIERHSDLRAVKVHGISKEATFFYWLESGGVAVTSYEATARLTLPAGFRYSLAVIDEAHYVKNPEAKRTKNVIRLCQQADFLLFMTGTALENRVDEMIALIDILQPDVAKQAEKISFMAGAAQFRDEVAPVYYRRKREDVLAELPELIENREWCTMGPEEEQAYEQAILSGNFMSARRVSWNVEHMEDSSKARRLLEIIAEAKADGRKVIVFTFFLGTAKKIQEMLGDACVGVIKGSVPPARRLEMIEDFDEAPDGSVLVSQIMAGGTGLNIQAASVVVICEPQYKPSTENQAISRAYRMGQARNVMVFRLLCEGSVDECMTELLDTKQRIFDAFADESSAADADADEVFSISEGEFAKIMESEAERIKNKMDGAAVETDELAEKGPEEDSVDAEIDPGDTVVTEKELDEGDIEVEAMESTETAHEQSVLVHSAYQFCGACGQPLFEGARFCAFCGTPLPNQHL